MASADDTEPVLTCINHLLHCTGLITRENRREMTELQRLWSEAITT